MISSLRAFFARESASGILLLAATLLAIFCANSLLHPLYQQFTQATAFLINEGLMSLFFLMVGLELKRGYLSGHLSSRKTILLPAIAALGGMLIPALIYSVINYHHPANWRGFAIPMATDIAFATGIVSLLGQRVPYSLRLFLLLLAIFDDIGAIIIIATVYTQNLQASFLLAAGLITFSLFLLQHYRIRLLSVYFLFGILLWYCCWQGGIHPTLSGVILSLFIPRTTKTTDSLGQYLEEHLQPWVAYGIMPIFAFANAGLVLQDMSLRILTDPLFFGIMAGLFIGKQLGVFIFSYVLIRFRFVSMPEKATWRHLYGVALLCGMGFTMSLFIGNLSFTGVSDIAKVRLGVLIGSGLSGIIAAWVLLYKSSGNHNRSHR